MTVPICPRCAATLAGDGDGSFTCTRDCGEWIDTATLPNIRMEPAGSDAREPRLPCARCRQDMEARTWGTIAYDRCVHGVWLEGTSRPRFHAELARAIDDDREIAKLEATLGDPAARREVAARFVALERRCERLERELARVDQRLTRARLDRSDIP
ncbi:MAG: hypothetical protein ABI867_28625 [Kofleriaceae bacterium]